MLRMGTWALGLAMLGAAGCIEAAEFGAGDATGQPNDVPSGPDAKDGGGGAPDGGGGELDGAGEPDGGGSDGGVPDGGGGGSDGGGEPDGGAPDASDADATEPDPCPPGPGTCETLGAIVCDGPKTSRECKADPVSGCPVLGPPLSCDDQTKCTDDACVEGAGCTHAGVACDDGDLCNGAETCDPATGCVLGKAPVCDDGLPCNGVETCEATKGCVAGAAEAGCCDEAADCDDGDPCNGQGLCELANGSCSVVAAPVCNDGDPCNGVESCVTGTGCAKGAPLGCDDGNACNGLEACESGEGCVEGTPLVCADDLPCNGVETCDPKTGCVAGVPPEGCCTKLADCEDGNPCNGTGKCEGGSCTVVPAQDCEDGNPCNGVKTCAAESGCVLSVPPLDCADGNLCNGNESCDAGQGCVSGTPAKCDDGNACDGQETCDPAKGCVEGTAPLCDDGDVCNGAESCEAEEGCVQGVASGCDDGNPCNGEETCDAEAGCLAGDPPECDDGDPCTGVELCDSEGCLSGVPLECSDGNVCNSVEVCVKGQGCGPGSPWLCDDGDPCNGLETCDPEAGLEGDCAPGTALSCDDGKSCTEDSCGEDGCVHTPVSDGESCEDGDLCTTGDFCDDGGCRAGDPLDCDDGLPCTSESCEGGTCVSTVKAGCLVDGACWADGESPPGNPCVRCDPTVAGPTKWVEIDEGSPCGASISGTGFCKSGACDFACGSGRADCDGDASNGCEADLESDLENCGKCGNSCVQTSGLGGSMCLVGKCQMAWCPGLSADADGDVSNGCEVKPTAKVLWVKAGAGGTADGTEAKPFPALNQALSAASKDTWIRVLPGVYTTKPLSVVLSGVAITGEGKSRNDVVLVADSAVSPTLTLGPAMSNLVVSKLTISGGAKGLFVGTCTSCVVDDVAITGISPNPADGAAPEAVGLHVAGGNKARILRVSVAGVTGQPDDVDPSIPPVSWGVRVENHPDAVLQYVHVEDVEGPKSGVAGPTSGISIRQSDDARIDRAEVSGVFGGLATEPMGCNGSTLVGAHGDAYGIDLDGGFDVLVRSSKVVSVAGGDDGPTPSERYGGRAVGFRVHDAKVTKVLHSEASFLEGGRGMAWSAGVHVSGLAGDTDLEWNRFHDVGVMGVPEDPRVGYGVFMDDAPYLTKVTPDNTHEGEPILYFENATEKIDVTGFVLTNNSNPTNAGKIAVVNAPSAVVRDNVVSGFQAGVDRRRYCIGSTDGMPGAGILLFNVPGAVIEGNVVSDIVAGPGSPCGGVPCSAGAPAVGIDLFNCNDAVVADNVVSGIFGGLGAENILAASGGAGGAGGAALGVHVYFSTGPVVIGTEVHDVTGGAGGIHHQSGIPGASGGAATGMIAEDSVADFEHVLVWDVLGGPLGGYLAVDPKFPASAFGVVSQGFYGDLVVRHATVRGVSGTTAAGVLNKPGATLALQDSIVYEVVGNCVRNEEPAKTEFTVHHALFGGCSPNLGETTADLGTIQTNVNPLFVSATNGDFHLQSASPAIDAGDPESDYCLEPAPNGGRADLGRYGNTPEATPKPGATHFPCE